MRPALVPSAEEVSDEGEAWGLYQPFLPAPVGSHSSMLASSFRPATPAESGWLPPSHQEAVREASAGVLAGEPAGEPAGAPACGLEGGWPAEGAGSALLPCQSLGLNLLSLDCESRGPEGPELVALPVSLHKREIQGEALLRVRVARHHISAAVLIRRRISGPSNILQGSFLTAVAVRYRVQHGLPMTLSTL